VPRDFASRSRGYPAAVSTTAAPVPSVVIEPDRGLAPRVGELWAFRELFYFLMWRDIKVRYKQTALGASWAVLQPLLLMAVFTVFLGSRGLSPKGIPQTCSNICVARRSPAIA
jgi:lipopolysaccharide transport system permease protein